MPVDSSGRKCGYDNEVVDQPNLFMFNATDCFYSAKADCTLVCVRQCPNVSFEYDERNCSALNFDTIKQNLICTYDVRHVHIKACQDITELINDKKCAKAYSPSESCK